MTPGHAMSTFPFKGKDGMGMGMGISCRHHAGSMTFAMLSTETGTSA